MSRERFLRLLDVAEYLAAHIHEAPIWIVPCLEGGAPSRTSGPSIYPAVQNMLLAARALGLGATLTTLYLAVREGSLGRTRIAARRPLLCAAADRLPHGLVRAGSPHRARRCRLRGWVGPALPRLSLAAMRWATAHLVGQLILALAQIDDMPEQTVRGPLDVTDLDDHFGAHPMDPAKH